MKVYPLDQADDLSLSGGNGSSQKDGLRCLVRGAAQAAFFLTVQGHQPPHSISKWRSEMPPYRNHVERRAYDAVVPRQNVAEVDERKPEVKLREVNKITAALAKHFQRKGESLRRYGERTTENAS